MKKNISILVIVYFIFFAWNLKGQNLTDKEQELKEIENKIKQQEKLLEQIDEKKDKTKSQINQSLQQKKNIEKKISEYTKKEQQLKQTLNNLSKNLDKTKLQLSHHQNIINYEFLKLFAYANEKELRRKKNNDGYLLQKVILESTKKFRKLDEKKEYMSAQKQKNYKNYKNVHWEKILTNKEKKNYEKEIVSLQQNYQQLDKKNQVICQKTEALKKQAQALNDLIKKLKLVTYDQEYSYEFASERLAWPVKGKIIRQYGMQRNAEDNIVVENDGIDIAVTVGTDVKAIDKGVVAYANRYGASGKLIIIDHQNGYFSLYSHNDILLVTKGEKVKKQQVIAKSGKTGSAEKACLHFEIRKDSKPVNPLNYLE